jgi:hypothetical protein
MRDSYLNSSSRRGAFGEFIYKTFCESKNFETTRTNYCHTDFLIKSKTSGDSVFVDVKSTLKSSNGFKRKRFHKQIIYDTISFNGDDVWLIPDEKSPFFAEGKQLLGSVNSLRDQWEQRKSEKIGNRRIIDDLSYQKLIKIFANSPYPKLRIVERGDASGKRWSGLVDNLPGSDATIAKYDASIFIKYGCSDFQHYMEYIFLIPHWMVTSGAVKMSEPHKRQRDKGIVRVVDLNTFLVDHSDLVFNNLESIEKYIFEHLVVQDIHP